MRTNPAAPGNGAVTSLFHGGRQGRAVPEPRLLLPARSMSIHISMIAVTASLLTAFRVAGAETTNVALAFYVLSEEKVAGGRFIDTAAIPKAGYIGPVADLVVTNLLDVYPQQAAPFSIMTDTNGNHIAVTNAARPALSIVLAPAEARRFAALTERAVRKKMLVMLGSKPLTAPVIMMPIDSGSIVIEFGHEFGGQAEVDKVERDLKKLITHKEG
jgi:hypothetical protein